SLLPYTSLFRSDLDLGGQRADVAQATAVDAEAVGDDAAADELLLHAAVGGGELLLATLEAGLQRGDHLVLDLVEAVLALLLARDRQGLLEGLRDVALDGGVGVVGVVREQ